ncbi:MAG: hypothetical protein ACFCUI_13880 [Bernardetiaceae bacterium]
MNVIITLIRLPFGIFGVLVCLIFWLSLFPFEFLLMILLLPFGAVFMSRQELRRSWVGRFPNTLRMLSDSLTSVWHWTTRD